MIKLIIFDWDDVIVIGSKNGYYDCYRETLKSLGVAMSEKEMDIRIKRRWGQPFKEELRELLLEKPELLEKANDIFYNEKFLRNTFTNALREVKGVNQLLEKLSKKYLLAVATGSQRNMLVDNIMPRFKIPNVFCQIVTAHDDIPAEKTKPDPLMINLILEKQRIKKEEAIFVGDAKNDVLMAKNAGVEPVVVLTGHLTESEAISLGVKFIIEDVTKMEDVIENHDSS